MGLERILHSKFYNNFKTWKQIMIMIMMMMITIFIIFIEECDINF